jgi:hypothetical protein
MKPTPLGISIIVCLLFWAAFVALIFYVTAT